MRTAPQALTVLLALILTGCVSSEPAASGLVPDGGARLEREHATPRPRLADRPRLVRPGAGVQGRPITPVAVAHATTEPRSNGGDGGDHGVSGTASWYCGHGSSCTRGYPDGLYAAAGPRLRIGDWRGRLVFVSAGGRSVMVRLIDWCQCSNGRLLDLYSSAFERLAPLSRGLVNVEVTYL
jgi:rare lipoprotein A (peptidoglycan hydrolase)